MAKQSENNVNGDGIPEEMLKELEQMRKDFRNNPQLRKEFYE